MAEQDPQQEFKAWAQDDWLKIAVGRGLQGLIALHLEGAPSHKVIFKTAGIWHHVMKNWPIAWHEELDRPRLRDAFTALASQAQRWPSPNQLRALLPARKYPQPALSPPDYPPEKAKENLKKIKDLIKTAIKTI